MEQILNHVYFEAAIRGNVNDFPFSNITKQDLHHIFWEVFPDGNILLYVVAKFGHSEIFAQIAHYYPFLINKKNNQWDTPFHCATPIWKLKQPPR